MKPYESGYSTTANFTAAFSVAWGTLKLFSHVPHCSVPCQNSQSSWGAQPDLWEKRKLIHITNDSNASSATRELNYYEIAKVIVGMLSIPEPWVLSLDRTSVAVWANHIQHSDFGHCSCAKLHFPFCGGCWRRRETLTPTSGSSCSKKLRLCFQNVKLPISPQTESQYFLVKG